jgi:hypothetical protein
MQTQLWAQASKSQASAKPAPKPQGVEITVLGTGAILANDQAAARDKAIDDAMRKAVQQALGTHIKSETLVENYQMVEDRILAWSSGYVTKYDILREGRGQYDMYEVQMRALVNLSDLKNDDQALAELLQKENPRVMVMIAEQNIGDTGSLASEIWRCSLAELPSNGVVCHSNWILNISSASLVNELVVKSPSGSCGEKILIFTGPPAASDPAAPSPSPQPPNKHNNAAKPRSAHPAAPHRPAAPDSRASGGDWISRRRG